MPNLHTDRAATPEPSPHDTTITIRDVVRHGSYQLSGTEPMLRVPYDLFNPVGPVQVRGDLIHYLQSGEVRTGRTAPGVLGDARPGERVLVQLPQSKSQNEWWLCEIVAVDGVEAD